MRAMRYIGALPRRGRPRLAAADRPPHLLFVAEENRPAEGAARRYRRRLAGDRRAGSRRAAGHRDAQGRPAADRRGDRRAAGRLSRGAGAARARGPLVQRHRAHRRDPVRHRDVAAGARPRPDARRAGADRAPGAAHGSATGPEGEHHEHRKKTPEDRGLRRRRARPGPASSRSNGRMERDAALRERVDDPRARLRSRCASRPTARRAGGPARPRFALATAARPRQAPCARRAPASSRPQGCRRARALARLATARGVVGFAAVLAVDAEPGLLQSSKRRPADG